MNDTWFIHSCLAFKPFSLFSLYPLYLLYPLFSLYPLCPLSLSPLYTHPYPLYPLNHLYPHCYPRYVPICTPAFSVDNCGREEEEGNHLAKSGESMQALAKVRDTVRVYLASRIDGRIEYRLS